MRPGLRNQLLYPPAWVLRAGPAAKLDIDFTKNRAWLAGARAIPDLLTCTRASVGYYTKADGTLISFLSNQLRYGDQGLLVEEARTNDLKWSNDFTNAAWPKLTGGLGTAAVVTGSYAAGPDGVAGSACRLQADRGASASSNDYSLINQSPSGLSSLARYRSIWLKSNTGSSQQVLMYDSGAAVGDVFTVTTSWQRFELTAGAASSASNVVLGTRGSSGLYFKGGDQTIDVLVFGAQLEAGAFATSFILTTTTSATRAADNISFGSLAWLLGSAGTFYGQGLSPTTAAYLLSGASGVALPRSGTAPQAIADNGTNTLTATAGSSTWATASKAALAYDGAGRALCMNNGAVATDANGIGSLASVYVGSNAGAASFLDGYIRRLAWWNGKLSNAALGALTT